MKVLSTISATTAGGRTGHGQTSDNLLTADFGQGHGKVTPEHLFALGYSACFGSALQAVAGAEKKTIPTDFSVTVTVPLILGDDGGYSIEADLKVSLPGMDAAEAQALVEKAHQVCPYSKATRNNIPVKVGLA